MCEWGVTATQVRLHRPKPAPPEGSGRTHVPVDPCIAPLVQALNDAGVETMASCCGHGRQPGSIALSDGSELVVAASRDEAEALILAGRWRRNVLATQEDRA